MDAITQLLSQYSIADIILIVLLVAVAFKFVSELYDWFHNRLKSKYEAEDEQEDKYEEVLKEIKALHDSLEGLAKETVENQNSFKADLSEMKTSLYSINERLLETIRSSIIDKHHKYMDAGEITDFALQSVERQYSYYKSAGGNTFINKLMDDIRTLKVINADKAIGDEKNATGA